MKRVKNIFITILLSFICMGTAHAASAKITVSPSSKTMVVGNTVTITVTTTSTSTLGAVSYTVQYDSNKLSLTKTNSPSGGARTVGYFQSKGNTTVSYTYTFKAISSGTTNISIIAYQAGDDAGNNLSVTTTSSKIKIMTQAELYATYSSNNNLSGLWVEGYELDPVFDKNTLEYNVSLKPETESINVTAGLEDNKSSISGIGKINVSEGNNVIKIDVVAQNGNIKTYTINAKVEEYDPINVTVDDKDYTVVRSKKTQTLNNPLFKETAVQIGEYEVPAYINEVTNTTLVALKDSEGIVSYFIYDNNKYTKFIELKLGTVDLMLKDKEIPKGYSKDIETINDINYTVYKRNNISRFTLVYGTNLVNNNESYYVYDNLENTLQRYDEDLINDYDNNVNKLTIIIYVLSGISIGLATLLIISLVPKKKKDKKVNKKKEK